MSDLASSIYRAVMAGNTQVSSSMSAAAQQGKGKAIQALLDKRYEAEQRIIDEQNRRGRAEQKRVYDQRQAVTYRLSVAQMVDARLQAREYELLSQDFLAKAQYKMGQMGSAYSRSGAVMAGSALLRTKQTQDRGAIGAARMRRAADYTMKRGKMLSTITKHSAVKPSFVPIPDAIRQVHVEMPKITAGGGGSSSGSRGRTTTPWMRPNPPLFTNPTAESNYGLYATEDAARTAEAWSVTGTSNLMAGGYSDASGFDPLTGLTSGLPGVSESLGMRP